MTTLLIDADIVAYKVASTSERSTDFNRDGNPAVSVDRPRARREAEKLVNGYAKKLKADSIIICLTDPDVNWRKEYEPTYKAFRQDTKKPELLSYVKEYLAEEYVSFIRPRLEADDIMGILATHPRLVEGEKIIVSEDKDMRTIPAKVYNPNTPKLGVMDISELDADRFHMWQTIVGDPTDGYIGARGVGKSSHWAEEIIHADREELWELVLEAYSFAGLTEDDAIRQARLARILRAEDYNLKTKGIRLWKPEKLEIN